MLNIRKVSVQLLLTLFVLNSAVCACASAGNAMDETVKHGHHSETSSDTSSDCDDDSCLGICDQALAVKPNLVTVLVPLMSFELEGDIHEPAPLSVSNPPGLVISAGIPNLRYLTLPDTPITRKDCLLS